MTAISPRSSTTETRCSGSSSHADGQTSIRSRSRVVFPSPGGDSSTVLQNCLSRKQLGRTASPAPAAPWPMRMVTDDRSRRLVFIPSRSTAVPHTPTRNRPPGGEIAPAQGLPGGVAGIVRHRASHSCSRSDWVTVGQIAAARDHLFSGSSNRHGSSARRRSLPG